jgi:hypothetical protein
VPGWGQWSVHACEKTGLHACDVIPWGDDAEAVARWKILAPMMRGIGSASSSVLSVSEALAKGGAHIASQHAEEGPRWAVPMELSVR